MFTLPGTLLRASPMPINQSVLQQLSKGDDVIPILGMLKLRLREVQGHTPWQDSTEPGLTHCGALSYQQMGQLRDPAGGGPEQPASGPIMGSWLQVLPFLHIRRVSPPKSWCFAAWEGQASGARIATLLGIVTGARCPTFPHFPGPERAGSPVGAGRAWGEWPAVA